MRLRKYCNVHDSVWDNGDECEAVVINRLDDSSIWDLTEPCNFETVDLKLHTAAWRTKQSIARDEWEVQRG